jgi:hypothetical protein
MLRLHMQPRCRHVLQRFQHVCVYACSPHVRCMASLTKRTQPYGIGAAPRVVTAVLLRGLLHKGHDCRAPGLGLVLLPGCNKPCLCLRCGVVLRVAHPQSMCLETLLCHSVCVCVWW